MKKIKLMLSIDSTIMTVEFDDYNDASKHFETLNNALFKASRLLEDWDRKNREEAHALGLSKYRKEIEAELKEFQEEDKYVVPQK